jgi:uncharacterized protein (DUF1800 family)
MGKFKSGDLFLIGDVTVRRGGTDKEPKVETVKGNRMVSETDLSDKEIEEIKKHGVLRVPTMDEISASENREDNESAAEAAKKAEEERVALQQQQKLEADQLEAEQKQKAAEAKAKLEADQAKEREAADKKAAGSGKGKK